MRNVLVSGASRGIGLAIAQRLAADGFRVIAIARSSGAALAAAIDEAALGPGEICFRAADLADIDAIAHLVRTLKAQYGPAFGLVNNAGMSIEGLLTNFSQAQIEAAVRLNTLAPIMLAKFAVRAMMVAGEGRIINISSIIATTGFNGLSVYGATKASLIGFTRSLSREVGRIGITVNAVAPGFIDTELTASMSAMDKDKIAKRSALGRLANATDVASAVAFLMSSGASNVTGTVLTVDAGSTA